MISVEEINASFAKENREALAGMRQWILDISELQEAREVVEEAT